MPLQMEVDQPLMEMRNAICPVVAMLMRFAEALTG
jgi:hypothetical protein